MRLFPINRLARSAAFCCIAAVTAAVYSPSAQAQIQTFELTYSGSALGNSATGTGTITLDLGAINNPGSTQQNVSLFVTAFSLTITGAITGNGTFGLADYNGDPNIGGFLLDTNGGTLDFSQELIGQPTAGSPFGTSNFTADAGDFNIFSNGSNLSAPSGSFPFEITTSRGTGNSLNLTSFRPAASAAAPEPGSLALLATGLLPIAGAIVRRRRSYLNRA